MEALTIEEAINELSFITVGLYQSKIGTGNGAPIRLTVPWKYVNTHRARQTVLPQHRPG